MGETVLEMNKISVSHGHVFLGNRQIGDIAKIGEEKVYISYRNRANHYVKRHSGWGIDVSVLEALKEAGFTKILLRVGEFETLTSYLGLWERIGIKDRLSDDFEEQVFLPEKYMLKSRLNLTQCSM